MRNRQGYRVVFWAACRGSVVETHATKRQACGAIAEFIRDELGSRPRLRSSLQRIGSAYRDGAVTVKHRAGGREYGAYIENGEG